MKVIPRGSMVLVRLDEEKSHEGIIEIPVEARSVQKWGVAAGVGPNVKSIRRGDRIMIPWATGTDVDIYGVNHRFIDESKVLAKEK